MTAAELLAHPLVIAFLTGAVTILGGGQVYLWLKVFTLNAEVAVLRTHAEGVGRTLARIDSKLDGVQDSVHSIDVKLAGLEGALGSKETKT